MTDTVIPRRGQQVFISYAHADRNIARRIADVLKTAGLRVWFSEWELHPGDSISHRIDDALRASDVLLVLLSPNAIKSDWVQLEWTTAVSQLSNRAVTVIPVLIEDCAVPALLARFVYLDLRRDFEGGLRRLTNQLGVVGEIDYSLIPNEVVFSEMVRALLVDMGFKIVQIHTGPREHGYDLSATYEAVDPLGGIMTQTWLIELKFYRADRVDPRAIKQLELTVAGFPPSYKGLLITNGQLTSVARRFLAEASERSRVDLRVIDGTDLRKLLSDRPEIVRRYFVGEPGHAVSS